MKYCNFHALLLFAFASALHAADPLPRATPESVGMSSERLARLTSALQAEVAKGKFPGAVVAVARNGKLVYFEAVGYLDPQTKTPMPKDAISASRR
jgi:CubicO group peptidase (beta-lactamase class C family)